MIEEIKERLCNDFRKVYGDSLDYSKDLYLLFSDIYEIDKISFVIIIDEWDCLIRNSEDKALVHKYLQAG